MPDTGNNIFQHMVDEAITEVSTKGWREAPQNAVTLAAFGMMAHSVEAKVDRLVKPAWLIGSSVFGGMLWFVIGGIMGVS